MNTTAQLLEQSAVAGRTVTADELPDHWKVRALDAETGEMIERVRWVRIGSGLLGIGRVDDLLKTDLVRRRYVVEHTETGQRWESA